MFLFNWCVYSAGAHIDLLTQSRTQSQMQVIGTKFDLQNMLFVIVQTVWIKQLCTVWHTQGPIKRMYISTYSSSIESLNIDLFYTITIIIIVIVSVEDFCVLYSSAWSSWHSLITSYVTKQGHKVWSDRLDISHYWPVFVLKNLISGHKIFFKWRVKLHHFTQSQLEGNWITQNRCWIK